MVLILQELLVLCLFHLVSGTMKPTVLKDGPGTGSGDVHNSLGWGLDDVGPLESRISSQHRRDSFLLFHG